ncbi:hypothetical protein [Caudoviricetes sp.]|nr:hypothetical protein [Caudoviricetes sp.]
MPRIQEYNPQARTGGAIDQRRIEGDGGVGAALQGLGKAVSTVGEVVYKRAEQAEVSNLSAKMASAHADFTNDFAQRLKDPKYVGDANFANKFIEDFDNHMSKLRDEVSTNRGQEYFDKTYSQLRGHFTVTATSGQSELAGVQAKTNFNTFFNKTTSSVISDPSSLGLTEGMLDTYLDSVAATKQVDAKHIEEWRIQGKKELNKNAMEGWIKLNPELAKKKLDSGAFDAKFDGDVKHQLYGKIDTEVRARRVQERLDREDLERRTKKNQEIVENDFIDRMHDPGESKERPLSTRDVLSSNLTPEKKRLWLNLLDTKSKGIVKTDAPTKIALFDRIHLPDGDPNKLTNEDELNRYYGNGLNIADIKQLRREMQGIGTQEGKNESSMKSSFLKMAKKDMSASNDLLNIRDPIGDENYQRFLTQFLVDYEKKRRDGVSAKDLLDPDHKEYLGKRIIHRSAEDIIMDKNAVGPAKTQQKEIAPDQKRKPGEGPDAYLKRVGKL